MSGTERPRRWLSGTLAALLVVGLGALWWSTEVQSAPRARFCTAGQAFTTIDGVFMPLQDQGSPGRDGCDGSDRPSRSSVEQAPVVGYDCKARDVDGTVVATTQPNRPDGTCGQPPRRTPSRPTEPGGGP